MGTNDTAIQHDPLHIPILGKVGKQCQPDFLFAPAGKPFVHAIPVTVALRKLAPLRTRAHHPVNTIQKPATGRFVTDVYAWMAS